MWLLRPPGVPRRLRESERPAGRQETFPGKVDSVSHATQAPLPPVYGSIPPKWSMMRTDAGYDTRFSITDPIFAVGDIINIVRTGEKVRVTGCDSLAGIHTIDVVRAVGMSTAAPVKRHDDLMLLGNWWSAPAIQKVTPS